MMEVGSSSLQSVSWARHIEQARPSSVDTGLSLGLPTGCNEGVSMSPQRTGLFPPMPVPSSSTAGGYITTSLPQDEDPVPASTISSFGQDTGTEASTMSQPGTVDGNGIISTSPPDNGLPPSIPTAAYWMTPTMPQNPLFIPTLLNVGSAKESDKAVSGDVGSENVIIAHTAVPFHTEATRVEVDDHRPDMATQPFHSEESQPSLTAFNTMYSGGETQLVHDSQVVEANNTQPAIAGETQLVNDHKNFDDMEKLPNNMYTISAPPLTNVGQVLNESSQGIAARPSQDSYEGPVSALSNGIPASSLTNVLKEERETYATAEGLNGRVSSTTVSTVNEGPEVYPVETAELLNLTEGKEEKGTITSEPRLRLLDETIEEKIKADGEKSPAGVAEIDKKDDVNAKIVSEQDIQAIKGRKVVKKFGRKNFEGEVVDYDAENQWFKVVYEDGDDEDLSLLEVKEILLNADTSSKASTARRKRTLPDGAVSDQQARKQKVTSKKKGSAAGAQKKVQVVKSPLESKKKGLKRKAKSKSPAASTLASHVPSQPAQGTKRKRSTDAKLESENVAEKENRKENRQGNVAKTPRKRSAKQGRGKAMAKKNSATKKETGSRSSSKLSVEAGEVESAGRDKMGKGKSNRRKTHAAKDQNTLVGKAVKKDFSGTLYSGVVTKFDKKTEYYKVQYEDGDQEDLELEELNAVLVH